MKQASKFPGGFPLKYANVICSGHSQWVNYCCLDHNIKPAAKERSWLAVKIRLIEIICIYIYILHYEAPWYSMGFVDLILRTSTFLCEVNSHLLFFSILCRRLRFSKLLYSLLHS